MSDMKCVIIIDSELPIGIMANTSAILGVTLGKLIPEQVGADVKDASGQTHLGIVSIPVTMLGGDKALLKDLRSRLYGSEFDDLVVADFSDVAQGCNIYSEYAAKAAVTTEQDHKYFGIAIYGSKKKVNKLTGSMALLR
ncbi:DUF2000 domain-containing protein [Lacrimispora indolis]|uniref:DUF2000 domain-containing protein n=1 Tax=Lacrimispora indolis TaxID=69825 RepID=UPI000404BA12|nr:MULTISPECIES: DUF2000 domain-containing protein [Lachnospiraceae]MBE7719230.1 DUF2000 domain-containing protein [Lacrimispora celerecrescens]